jgi:hypothetical protein
MDGRNEVGGSLAFVDNCVNSDFTGGTSIASAAYCVNKIMNTVGSFWKIWGAASIPFIMGIANPIWPDVAWVSRLSQSRPGHASPLRRLQIQAPPQTISVVLGAWGFCHLPAARLTIPAFWMFVCREESGKALRQCWESPIEIVRYLRLSDWRMHGSGSRLLQKAVTEWFSRNTHSNQEIVARWEYS